MSAVNDSLRVLIYVSRDAMPDCWGSDKWGMPDILKHVTIVRAIHLDIPWITNGRSQQQDATTGRNYSGFSRVLVNLSYLNIHDDHQKCTVKKVKLSSLNPSRST
jgi:hypothetical protein